MSVQAQIICDASKEQVNQATAGSSKITSLSQTKKV
jgi:hypothetical protein